MVKAAATSDATMGLFQPSTCFNSVKHHNHPLMLFCVTQAPFPLHLYHVTINFLRSTDEVAAYSVYLLGCLYNICPSLRLCALQGAQTTRD